MEEDGAMHDIEIRELRKSFGAGREVLKGIDLQIPAGSFVGLMGPNGAGKSTLIKILGGVYGSSSGEIRFGGRPVRSLEETGEVAFIHQDLGLVDDLTIAENLRLGAPPISVVGLLNRRGERRAAERALSRVGLDLAPDAPVGTLSVGEKALLAIARALDRGAKAIVVDEATSTLPPSDAAHVVEVLSQRVRDEQTSVVIVSHKLSEILDVTSRIVILIDGEISADVSSEGLDRAQLVSLLVRHEVKNHQVRERRGGVGTEVLRLENARSSTVGPISMSLRAGEVFGITGRLGSGLHDVAYLVHGSEKATGGRIVKSRPVRSALVPPHRESQGGFGELSVRANLTISALRRWRRPWQLIDKSTERADSQVLIDQLAVRPADPDAAFGVLSGGNQQKVIFGRALMSEPDVFVLCEPTRGVDVTTRAEIYSCIETLRERGAAVLIVTSDTEDLLAVCDQIAVIEDGKVGEASAVDPSDSAKLEALI
jgi:ribose transport system ATP-binding protein